MKANRSISRIGAITCAIVLLPILSRVGGCVGPCSSLPLPLLPLAIAFAAIDDNALNRSNADFVIAGQIVDGQGQPVDAVETEVGAWIATHRSGGFADKWTQRTEKQTVGSAFKLKVQNAEILDVTLRRDGYAGQHLIFCYGYVQPPFIKIRDGTSVRWDGRENTQRIDSAELEDGGMYYEGVEDDRPFRKEDLRIVMEQAPTSRP